MKNKQFKKNNEELIRYLKAQNIILPSKTLKFLSDEEVLEPEYYGIFKTSPKIINYFLVNPILWNDEAFSFIMEMTKSYDENTILRILKNNLYAPFEFWQYASDKRIPKLDRKNDYLRLISNQQSDKDMKLAYEAFLYPLLRSNAYYLDQVENLDQKNKRKSLVNEISILEKTKNDILQESLPKIENQLKMLSRKKGKEVSNFYLLLKEYNDILSIKYFASLEDLNPYIELFQAVNKVRNVDEFESIQRYMIAITNLVNRKDKLNTSFQVECYEFDCSTLPRLLEKDQIKIFKNGYLNVYLIMEQLLQYLNKVIEEPYILKRK